MWITELEKDFVSSADKMYHDRVVVNISMVYSIGNLPTFYCTFTDGILKYETKSYRNLQDVIKEKDYILSLPIIEREKLTIKD